MRRSNTYNDEADAPVTDMYRSLRSTSKYLTALKSFKSKLKNIDESLFEEVAEDLLKELEEAVTLKESDLEEAISSNTFFLEE